MKMTDTKIRLHLSAGDRWTPHFRCLDKEPTHPQIERFDFKDPLPCEDGTVDVVIWPHGLASLQGPADREQVLREVHRVLKPGGWFRIDENPNRFWVRQEDADVGYYNIPRELLVKMLEVIGFKVYEIPSNTTKVPDNAEANFELLGAKTWHESFTLECEKL
jgi:SAM-dependent methyltransferase